MDKLDDSTTLLAYSLIESAFGWDGSSFCDSASGKSGLKEELKSDKEIEKEYKRSSIFKERKSIRDTIKKKIWKEGYISLANEPTYDDISTKRDNSLETSSIYSETKKKEYKFRFWLNKRQEIEVLNSHKILKLHDKGEIKNSPGECLEDEIVINEKSQASINEKDNYERHGNGLSTIKRIQLKRKGLYLPAEKQTGYKKEILSPHIWVKERSPAEMTDEVDLSCHINSKKFRFRRRTGTQEGTETDFCFQRKSKSRTKRFSDEKNETDLNYDLFLPKARLSHNSAVHQLKSWLYKYFRSNKYFERLEDDGYSEVLARILQTRHNARKIAFEAAANARRRNTLKATMFSCAVITACFATAKMNEKTPGVSHGSLATEYMRLSEKVASVSLNDSFHNKDYQKLRRNFQEHFKYRDRIDYFRAITPIPVKQMDKKSGAYQMYIRMKKIPAPPVLDHTVLQFHLDRFSKRGKIFGINVE